MTVAKGSQHTPLLAQQQVIEAYDIVLRRHPDASGLETFTRLLLDGIMTQHEVILALYQSEECAGQPARPPVLDEYISMVSLSSLFAAAQDGRLLDDYADDAGGMKVGFLPRSLLARDMSAAIILYSRQCLGDLDLDR